ncbi:MAG TPA: hypothetical protein VMU62_07155, partial [Acidobacteriaceae bacterium]|nr:hypothetical protein [Acidobacteriaceae bacterium]
MSILSITPHPSTPHPPQKDEIPPTREPVPESLPRQIWALLRYLSRTEVHTYAFSVAANAILS